MERANQLKEVGRETIATIPKYPDDRRSNPSSVHVKSFHTRQFIVILHLC